MGVLPLQFEGGASWKSFDIKGDEVITIPGVPNLRVRQTVVVKLTRASGETLEIPTLCRIDTENELDYFNNGGILPYVLRNLAKAA
jgi:aconitate hydratase